MSIATEIAALAANKAAIKAAITAKNPATAPTESLSQWPTSIASISQSADIFVPPGGWKNDGNTHIWVEIPEDGIPYKLTLKNTRFGNYNATVSWGDGSQAYSVQNSKINTNHEYQSAGTYVIDIASDDMTYLSNDSGTETSNPYNIFGQNEYNSCPVVVYVEIGSHITQTIAAFLKCNNLIAVNASNALTYIGGYTCYKCRSLRKFYAPEATGIGVFAFSQSSLMNIDFPKAASFGNSAFRDCLSLMDFTAPASLATIGTNTFEDSVSLKTSDFASSQVAAFGSRIFYNNTNNVIKLPPTTTSIGTMFCMYGYRLIELWVYATTPPTLESNSFSSSPVAIYVPSQSVETYKGASNWSSYASAIQEMPA